ncbi:MAG: DUF188 domain-containing protein [Spirochaetota bacterium]
MKILVDSDSCPKQVRTIIARASIREHVKAVFVANRKIPILKSDSISMVLVSPGEGGADEYILKNISQDDIVITRDIPLAAELVKRGILTMNDRGMVFSMENIGERLSMRDFMHNLRQKGINIPEEDNFGPKEVKSFADAFDREFHKLLRRENG